MPVSEDASHVNLSAVCQKSDQAGPSSEDYNFIRSHLQDIMANAVIQEGEKIGYPEPVVRNAASTVEMLVALLEKQNRQQAAGDSTVVDDGGSGEESQQLVQLLTDEDLQGLLHAHDDIANRNFGNIEDPVATQLRHLEESALVECDFPRLVLRVHRKPNQPLGVTVYRKNDGRLVVSKIAPGSLVEQRDLLRVGDIVIQVNGEFVETPDQVTNIIRQSGADITFTIIPALMERNDSDDGLLCCGSCAAWSRVLILLEEKRRDAATQAAQQDKDDDKTKSSLLCGLGRKKKKKAPAAYI